MIKCLSILPIALIMITCSSPAHIEKSWRDPEVTVDMARLDKVVVVALLRNEANRRTTEEKLVSMLNGKGVASYHYFTEDLKEKDEEIIKNKLKQENFDGAVIMRLADVDKDVKYIPGNYATYPPYYGRFWRYYWMSRNNFYQPGYYESTKRFTVETNVYALQDDKLVWSGLTSYVDPKDAEDLMSTVAKEVYRKMKKEGFIVND